MISRTALWGLAALLFACFIAPAPGLAAPPPNLRESVAVCDPNAPSHCLAPDSSGALPVTGGGGGGGGTSSTFGAAFPTTGTAIGFSNGTDMVSGMVDGSGYVEVNCETGCSATGLAQGSTTSGQLGGLIMGAVTTSAPTYTTAKTDPLSLDTAGNLRVNCITGCSGGSGGAVYGPTANGSAAANPPVLMGGTQTASGTGIVSNWVVNSSGAGLVSVSGSVAVVQPTASALNETEANSAAILSAVQAAIPAGSAIIGKVGIDQTTPGTTNGVQDAADVAQGSTTSGQIAPMVQCSVTTSPPTYTAAKTDPVTCDTSGNTRVIIKGAAFSSEPAAATTATPVADFRDLAGKEVTSPYANRENMVRGSASETGTSAGTILAASGSASLKEYLTDLECSNTSATTIYVTINDGASSIFIVPAGGGNNNHFNVPLVAAANTAVTFTSSGSASTVYCSAQGYNGY